MQYKLQLLLLNFYCSILSKANGFYANGKIVLASNADGGMMSVYFGHELFHDLKVNSAVQAQKLEDFVIEHLKNDSSYDYDKRVDEIIELNKFKGTREQQVAQANEEIAANACFTVLSEQENFEKLVKQDKPLAQKVRDFFADFLEKIKNALRDISSRNAEYKALKDDIEAKEQILNMFDDCLKTAQKNNTIMNDSVKYALKENFDNNTDFSENINKVVTMNSVCDMQGTEFAKGQTDLITQVSDYFDSLGNIVHSKYGDIILNRTGVKSSVAHGIGRNKAVAFTAVPDVIKNGLIIDYKSNYKNRKYDTAVFAAPVSISNEEYFMAAVVTVKQQSNEYYLHEVALQKKEDNVSFKTGNSKSATPSDTKSSIYSLLNKLQNVNSNNLQDKPKYSRKEQQTKYTYDYFINKPDMKITEIDDKKNYIPNKVTRENVVNSALESALSVGHKDKDGNTFVYVNDINTNVMVSKRGLRHSLDRRLSIIAPVTENIGTILKNSVRINELIPEFDTIEKSYALIGIAKNKANEPYVVSFVVNRASNEIVSIDVLYAINAKKEATGLIDPELSSQSDVSLTASSISISNLLDYVNKYYPDILSEDVLKHYGYNSRPDGNIETYLNNNRGSVVNSYKSKDALKLAYLVDKKGVINFVNPSDAVATRKSINERKYEHIIIAPVS